MAAPTTTALLASLLALLEAELGDLADRYGRYDGAAVDAVEEHYAELRGAAGASVLVGFLADDVVTTDEAGHPMTAQLQPSVLLVRRRDLKTEPDAETPSSMTTDAEALDGLYDAALRALAESGWRVARSQALQGDTRDWFARAIVCRTTRSFPPGA